MLWFKSDIVAKSWYVLVIVVGPVAAEMCVICGVRRQWIGFLSVREHRYYLLGYGTVYFGRQVPTFRLQGRIAPT